MTRVDLIRIEESAAGTFGVLRIEGKAFCVTLEPQDKLNRRNISNIPPGKYICRKVTSPRFGKTFEVLKVPNRSHILFHAGNTQHDTRGCILLGRKYGVLRHNRAILNSGKTFKEFIGLMYATDEFELNIIEVN